MTPFHVPLKFVWEECWKSRYRISFAYYRFILHNLSSNQCHFHAALTQTASHWAFKLPRSAQNRVVILGGSSSAGKSVVEAFVKAGDHILTTYNDSPLAQLPSNATSCRLDLRDNTSISDFVEIKLAAFGAIDRVVLLPGVLPGKSLGDYDDSEIDHVVAINFTSQVKLVRRMLPYMADGSLLIFVSSISGERGSYDPIYAASKGAMIPFAKSLATWLAPKIRCVVVSSALIQGSTMFQAMQSDRRAQHLERMPNKELVDSEDLARVIVDISQPHWRHANGSVIQLYGGS